MFELVNILSVDAMVETFFVLIAATMDCPLLANALASKEAKARVKSQVVDMLRVARGEDNEHDLYDLYSSTMAQDFVDMFGASLGGQADDVYYAAKKAYEGYLDMLRERHVWFV